MHETTTESLSHCPGLCLAESIWQDCLHCQARTVTQAVLRRESWTAKWGCGFPTAPLLPGGK